MKTLSNFIVQLNGDALIKHLAIDYSRLTATNILLEKYAVYTGVEELCAYIVKQIEKCNKNGKEKIDIKYNNVCNKFKNIFFKTLHITINVSFRGSAEYQEWKSTYDESEKIFNEIFIEVKPNADDKYGLILHELTHAYDDYLLHLKNKEIIDASNKEYYYSIVKDFGDTHTKYNIHELLYILFGYEQNAFIAQLKAQLQKHKEKINSPHDAYKILKDADEYKRYKFFEIFLWRWKMGKLRQQDIEEATNEYNKISKTNLTANKVFKKLVAMWKKTMNKLDTIIPKMCIENLNNNKITLVNI